MQGQAVEEMSNTFERNVGIVDGTANHGVNCAARNDNEEISRKIVYIPPSTVQPRLKGTWFLWGQDLQSWKREAMNK
ncbi:hypothetical protein NC653_029857 [Populus alba x Populus x berolinensis]|uniref:Uncharacterized protein n=1 Tax=Populus alba x Populus x berolinensis TaxID=444605 RepID=A0AAD6Q3N5_9ROSI|nr:hypothetical protein NC653_029857 [Populus alba x Populus x berolinensis]